MTRKSRLARAIATPVGCLVLLLAVTPAATAKPTRPKPAGTLALSSATVIGGEKVTATGKVAGRTKRKVALQVATGKRWTTVAKGKSSKKGRYALTAPAPATLGSTKVRVKVAATGRLAAGVTKTRTLAVTAQSASVTLPASTLQSGTITAAAAFSPARPGRAVRIEQLVGGAWTSVATGQQAPNGTVSIPVVATTSGTASYRATALASNGAAAVSSSPVSTSVTSTWTAIYRSTNLTCGIKTDATAWCWGANESGQVGDGTTTDRSVPTQVPGSWTMLSITSNTACGLQTDGSGWCWGSNLFGSVGDGTSGNNKLVPTRFPGTWRSIDNGGGGVCGVRVDATGWCWGINSNGQLGLGDTATRTVPTQLAGAWSSIVSGSYATCGVRTDSTGWCWGDNFSGTVGDGTSGNDRLSPSPLPGLWSSLSTTIGGTTCGIRTNATGWCWGYNEYGQVGNASTAMRTTPFQLSGSWATLTQADYSTCGTRTDGTGWCWGLNSSGGLGDGTTTDRTSPTQLAGLWSRIVPNTDASCGTRPSGAGLCWGNNASGAVGSGAPATEIPTPTALPGAWTAFTSRGFGAFCGLRADRTAACWGANGQGAVGDGTTATRTTPYSLP